jgi:hypothetical protein
MKIQQMLGRSTKSRHRCKPANRNRVLSAIGHLGNPDVVLVEEEGRIKLYDHFFIPIISKGPIRLVIDDKQLEFSQKKIMY